MLSPIPLDDKLVSDGPLWHLGTKSVARDAKLSVVSLSLQLQASPTNP